MSWWQVIRRLARRVQRSARRGIWDEVLLWSIGLAIVLWAILAHAGPMP